MIFLEKSPFNKELFLRLIDFFKDVVDVCDEVNVDFLIYGSLAVFVYTFDIKMKVNDIDVLIKEKDFRKLIKAFDEKGIKYNYDKKWHVLQVLKDDLKIEFDSIEFWQKDLLLDFLKLDLFGKTVKILSLDSLKKVYEKAAKVSSDNALGNKIKLKMLEKISFNCAMEK